MIDFAKMYAEATIEELTEFNLFSIPVVVENKALSLSVVNVSLFDEALNLIRDLAEHQNGVPLIRHEEEYNKTMTEVWDFLEANET